MPNWCENIVEVVGDVNDIRTLIDVQLDFEELHPCPMFEEVESFAEQQAKYNEWMEQHWGTTWELDTDNLIIDYDEDEPSQVKFMFLTAWQPCCEFLLHLTKTMSSLEIRHKFYEPGCNIVGDITYKLGEVKYNDIPSTTMFVNVTFGEEYPPNGTHCCSDDDDCDDCDDDSDEKVYDDRLTNLWEVHQ